MKLAAAMAVLVGTAVLAGCSDDDDDVFDDDIIDDDDDGVPTMREWTADLDGLDTYDDLDGTATVRQLSVGAQSFTASATIRNDVVGAVRPWHVHFGTCATGGGIVGEDRDYPRLTVGNDGTATASVTISVPLDPNASYHVNVHLSDAALETIIACGNLERTQP